MPSEGLPPPRDYWLLYVAIIDGDIYPVRADTEQAAAEMSKQINEYGFWTGLKYYPVHRIDYMEVIIPKMKKVEK